MSRATGTSRAIWAVIWGVAIVVSLIGGSWHVPTSVPPNWKVDIQFPGLFLVLYMGWLMGPLQVMMSPSVVCVLTILTNVLFYYALVRGFLFFRRKQEKR